MAWTGILENTVSCFVVNIHLSLAIFLCVEKLNYIQQRHPQYSTKLRHFMCLCMR